MVEKYTCLVSPEREDVESPSVFLVGPITNAPDWQSKAVEVLLPHLNVLNPRRPWFGKGEDNPEKKDIFDEQVAWELDYQEKATIVLAWFAKGLDEGHPRMIGRTSRVELGWHLGSQKPIVVGVEPGFPGERYLRYFCDRFNIPVYDTLEETCRATLDLVSKPA